GTVTFYNGSTAIGTANVNAGAATLNTTFASSGKIALKAIFAANASWETSTSNQISLFITGNTPDTVVLQINPPSLVIGDSATSTANISPAEATGTVVFYDGTQAIGTSSVVAGMATYVNLFMAAGSQSITAVYSGDTTYASNTSSPVTLSVGNPGSTPTTTTLTLSEYLGYLGDTVTLTAKVNPSAATGQVDFYDNGIFLQGVVLSSGTAAWSQAFTQSYSNSITAVYDGDVTYSQSTSNSQNLELSDNSD
ncbi:MAG: Ig-like domain-containing protein, partial [Terracidiphilus sp.]